jgi:thiamine pyrophosphokinase
MPAEERVVSSEVVVVVAGGGPPHPESALAVPLGAPVVAADGGIEHARTLGLSVDVAVGDFDSATAAAVSEVELTGARIERHPADKDQTDLELALDAALGLHPERLLVLAGDGGRLDHLLAGLLLLGSARYSSVQVDARIGPAKVHVIRGMRVLVGEPGELISLLALHGPAERVRTEGLVYPLANETVDPGSTRGVSNLFAENEARVQLERGVLVAVRPGPEASVAQ